MLEDELEKVVVGTDDDTQKEVEQVSEETTGDEKYDSITKAQIMQELDAFGIEYDKKSTKRVLYDLMLSQGE